MKKRKRLHGGINLFLGILLTVLLNTFSTCYAYVSEDYVTFCLNRLKDNAIVNNNQESFNNYINNFLSNSSNISYTKTYINDRLTEYNWNNLNDFNMVCFVYSSISGSDNVYRILFNISNQTAPQGYSNVGFISLFRNSDIEGTISGKDGYILNICLEFSKFYPNGHFTYNRSTSTSEFIDLPELIFDYNKPMINFPYNFYNYAGTQIISYNYNYDVYYLISDEYNTYTNYINNIPSEPSGDGGGGTVTPSGDGGSSSTTPNYTNQLNDINSNISNSSTAITNQISGDTQKVIGAIDNANENYWGKSDELTGKKQEEEIENNVNELIENISGELADNQIIKMLDDAEKGFIDKFNYRYAPPEFYELKFEWDDIKFKLPGFVDEEITIIPKNELNISKICSENETMGVIKGYIRIIATFAIVMNILKTIYNLILTAMGIIQPELKMNYETPIADKEIDSAQGGYMIEDTIHL